MQSNAVLCSINDVFRTSLESILPEMGSLIVGGAVGCAVGSLVSTGLEYAPEEFGYVVGGFIGGVTGFVSGGMVIAIDEAIHPTHYVHSIHDYDDE